MSFITLGARTVAALVAAASVALVSIAAAAPDPPDAASATNDDASAADEPALIRFSFKGATFDQVIDFFSRAAGLPVVREADVPQGTLDYLAPEAYTLDEALDILNIILQSKGVALRVSDDMLYLQKLEEMQREDIPVFVGELPAKVGETVDKFLACGDLHEGFARVHDYSVSAKSTSQRSSRARVLVSTASLPELRPWSVTGTMIAPFARR